jgi:cytochrome c553
MSVQEHEQPDPRDLDRPWRLWPTLAILGVLFSGVLLGVIIIPAVQGSAAGLDFFTSVCRALGILPGSPAVVNAPDRTAAHPVSEVVWTPDILQVLAAADPERGRAKVVEVCSGCHGERGDSISPEFPHLAGQSGAAIYKQLHDYRTGSRVHELMTPVAKAIEESEIADLAAYYAGQPKRNANPVTLAAAPPYIVKLVELGDPNRNIPPCAACHRPGAGGPIETPVLSEQREEYLTAQLQAYASGERTNDVYGRMRTIAARLTADEIRGLAFYYRAGFR